MPIISLGSILKQAIDPMERITDRQEILVNKRTHQIRYEQEDENQVTVVIEKKQDPVANTEIGERPATT